MNNKNNKDKYFLVKAITVDGEHEHRGHVIVKAKTIQKAMNFADKEIFQHDDTGMDTDDAYFGYGDNLTASRMNGCATITKSQAQTLRNLGVAHLYPNPHLLPKT